MNGIPGEHQDSTSASGWGTANEIGRGWTQADYYWQGAIEDLRVYRRALSPSEITAQFEADPKSQANSVEVRTGGDPQISAAIDRLIEARLQALGLEPAGKCSDAEFQRRVMLDLAGRVPTAAETLAFLADTDTAKRHHLIDQLLSGREMPGYWSQRLAKWLMTGRSPRDEQFIDYLRGGLWRRKSWDEFARDMLLARPAREDRYATAFLSTLPASSKMVRSVARLGGHSSE